MMQIVIMGYIYSCKILQAISEKHALIYHKFIDFNVSLFVANIVDKTE